VSAELSLLGGRQWRSFEL